MEQDRENVFPAGLPFYKVWSFWTTLILLLTNMIGAGIALDNHFEAKAEKRQRLDAEATAKIAREAEGRAEERIRELEAEQASMRSFLINYSVHLNNINNALSRVDEGSSLEAQEETLASIGAFVSFIEKWRQVQPLLRSLLNGTVNQLHDAKEGRDFDAIRTFILELQYSLADQGPLLEKQIDDLKRKTEHD